jgi:hypothetical protein
MSVRSEHIEGAFSEGYWAVQVRLRGDGAGPRYLCHAANDREARKLAEALAASVGGSRGFSYHRLETAPPAVLPALGQHLELSDEAWRSVADKITGYDALNPRAD